ncbi:MAG: type IX secretion system plug protein domain-containing protein [Bacteroidota bacterium]
MKNLLIITIIPLLVQCEPVVPQKSLADKKMVFNNHEYESLVGNINFYPVVNGQENPLENPIVNLSENENLLINFDLLTEKFENLSGQIYHCNEDWTLSPLREMEYLNEINNFRITEFDYSVNTVQPYINYRFQLPKPSISGNYIVAVFRRANPKDLLFTRKFLVYESITSINQLVRISNTIDNREKNQQIEFSIFYGNLFVNAPMKDLSITILQNHNWRSALRKIPPTLIRANEGSIEYRHMDETTNFPGWNEFRWTDLRTLNVAGRNVASVQNTGTEIFAQLGMDKSRAKETYTQNFRDINGNYVIQNNDQLESMLNTDYTRVRFLLQNEKVSGKVFVTGRFNNWKLEDKNAMNYDATKQHYYTDIYLKQGYYDYKYIVMDSKLPPFYFEGSYFQTENEYEILVYYRRPGNINDELVGYKKFRSIEDL